jgi:hypothetical protein
MNRQCVVAALFLGIAACATTVPQSPESGIEAGNSATTGNSTTPAIEMAVVNVPEESEVASVPVQDEIVCRMEKRTGSHRATRVCRSRSQTARSSREGMETFETLRQSQMDQSQIDKQ